MIRHPIGALLAYLALALAPAAASAAAAQGAPQRWPTDGPAFQTARQVAVAHWGIDPCAGNVALSWGRLPPGENAVAGWTNPFGDYGDGAHNTGCTVVFNTEQDWDWGKLCTIVVHELGHLAGHAHSADPDDVMFADYLGRNLPECASVSPAGSRAPTAPRQGRRTPAKKAASRSKAYRAGTTRHPGRTGSRTRRR